MVAGQQPVTAGHAAPAVQEPLQQDLLCSESHHLFNVSTCTDVRLNSFTKTTTLLCQYTVHVGVSTLYTAQTQKSTNI